MEHIFTSRPLRRKIINTLPPPPLSENTQDARLGPVSATYQLCQFVTPFCGGLLQSSEFQTNNGPNGRKDRTQSERINFLPHSAWLVSGDRMRHISLVLVLSLFHTLYLIPVVSERI